MGLERDDLRRSRGEIDAFDVAADRGKDRLAVWRKDIGRHKVAGRQGLLVVALDGGDERAVGAAVEGAHAQAGLAPHPDGVDQQLAVRREDRPHGAALIGDDGFAGVGGEVHPLDGPQRQGYVVLEQRTIVNGVIDIAAVRRGRGPQGAERLRAGRPAGQGGAR